MCSDFSKCFYINCFVISLPLVSYSNFLSLNTPDTQSPGPSASLLQTLETPKNTDRGPATPQSAGEGDTQMKYLSHQLFNSNIAAVTNNTFKNLCQCRHCSIFRHLSSPIGAGVKACYCNRFLTADKELFSSFLICRVED